MVIVALFGGLILGAGITQAIHARPNKHPLLEALQPNQRQDYWIMCTPNRVYLYDSARYVGGCDYGKDGLDSLILKDNE